ncbi:MAG: VOC family protein [Myxococcota bacterium]
MTSLAPPGASETYDLRRSMNFQQTVTFLYTDDLATTATFYEDVLGLELALDQGSCRIYTTSPGAFVGFCERDEGAAPAGVIFTLVTDDVDGAYEELAEAGVTFEKEPAYNGEYAIYHCFLRDPNGYLIEIQRFEDPGWPTN